jgi:2-keto-3-deoxygluconate permease
MLVTALINTFIPGVLRIGNPTTALFSSAGTMTFIGLLLFISGSQLRFNDVGNTVKRGGVFVILRLLIGFFTSMILINMFGLDGVFGISTMAFVIAMANCNPGVYMALTSQFGDNIDRAAMGVINIIAVPAVPLLILNMSAGSGFDIMIVITTLAPFIIGMILGNLDSDIQKLFAPGTPIVLIMMGFCFGSSINFINAIKSGFSGILLGIVFLVISIPIMLAADKGFLKRPGYAGVAFSCIGGVSISTPPIIAAVLPQFAPYVDAAVGQLAMATVLSAILVPICTRFAVKKWGSAEDYDKKNAGVSEQK